MSKHVGRKKRWTQVDAKTHTSGLGRVVYDRNAWFALLDFRTRMPPRQEGGVPEWLSDSRRLGPFKRPRDAMVALEREATFLKNRHREDILFGDQLWAEGEHHAIRKM
jgi:hypothetical protein